MPIGARTHTFRFLVEVELAHNEGRLSSKAELERLLLDTVQEMFGAEQTFAVSDYANSYYQIMESRVAPIEASVAKRFFSGTITAP